MPTLVKTRPRKRTRCVSHECTALAGPMSIRAQLHPLFRLSSRVTSGTLCTDTLEVHPVWVLEGGTSTPKQWADGAYNELSPGALPHVCHPAAAIGTTAPSNVSTAAATNRTPPAQLSRALCRTLLYRKRVLRWVVNGQSRPWATNADSACPLAALPHSIA